jgi:hypothetical protein
VLTETGLNKIEFRQTTMAAKADWFHRKIRSRNLRYGFTAERRLLVPGDITSSEMIDTDNDGGWTSYYIGSLGARDAVRTRKSSGSRPGNPSPRWSGCRASHTNTGFPARTFERKGFEFSDTDRWRDFFLIPPGNGRATASSDEICSQTFAHAVMWELVATNATERARVATNFVPIVERVLAHDLYLIDVDGKPTLWGRWNPDEYVNWFPAHHPRPPAQQRRTDRQPAARFRDDRQPALPREGLRDVQAAWVPHEQHPQPDEAHRQDGSGYVHLGNNMGDEWEDHQRRRAGLLHPIGRWCASPSRRSCAPSTSASCANIWRLRNRSATRSGISSPPPAACRTSMPPAPSGPCDDRASTPSPGAS